MDAVSAGWSRMTWDGETAVLRTTSADGNEYAIPSGYEEVTDYLSGRDVPLHLSVFMEGPGAEGPAGVSRRPGPGGGADRP